MAEGETFKATVISTTNNGNAIVFDWGYVDLSSGSGHIDTGIAAGDFQTLVQAKLLAALPEGVTIRKYRFACVGGTHNGEIGYVETSGGGYEGSVDNSNMLPLEMAISMKRSTGYASRRDRGRIFFGPVASEFRSTENSDQTVITTELTNVLNLLKADLTTQSRTLRPVILASDGTYSGRIIIKVAQGLVFVHRKSRRFREAI